MVDMASNENALILEPQLYWLFNSSSFNSGILFYM
jgi:hypothetical protein